MRTMHQAAITLTADETSQLELALKTERRVRHWQRFRGVWLLAHGQSVQAVAQTLGCCPASVYNWVQRWREGRLGGLVEAPHVGRVRKFDERGEALLDSLLAQDPLQHGFHSTGWTVQMLHSQVEADRQQGTR